MLQTDISDAILILIYCHEHAHLYSDHLISFVIPSHLPIGILNGSKF